MQSKASSPTPRQFTGRYEGLPDTPGELLQVVQGLVIHGDQGGLYGVTFSKRQTDEELLRTIPQMLEKILEIDSGPLTAGRPPSLRLVGMCRDYSLLLVSFLRHKGIPARLRVGFANYFESELMYEDHWLVEYYDTAKDRWMRTDAQVDAVQKAHFAIPFDTMDMPEDDHYLLGGQAWIKARSGERHQDDFGYNKNWKGWHSVKGNLLHDFHCLLGMELLPWDLWTELSTQKYSALTRAELDLLDETAALTITPAVTGPELRFLLDRLPPQYMAAIRSKLKVLDVLERTATMDAGSLEPKFTILPAQKDPAASLPEKTNHTHLVLKGCRQNNLKNVDVAIPKDKLTVITGVSGSGKSSLAFDTVYAEGKRRYLDNMSDAAKMQEQVEKPDYDTIQGLTPTIAIEQKKGSQNPRSTVGTLTGILDHLRMLYVSVGLPHCPYCGIPVRKDSKSKNRCPACGSLFGKLTAFTFNTNAHVGSCHDCNGLGLRYEVDPGTIIIDGKLSVLDGATAWWGRLRGKKITGNWMVGELYAIAEDMGIDLDQPWDSLPEPFKQAVLYGSGDKVYSFKYNSGGRNTEIKRPVSGAVSHIGRLFRESKSDDNPQMQFMRETPCATCHGERLCPEARYTTVMGYRLPELTKMPIQALWDWVNTLCREMPGEQRGRAGDVLPEIETRVANLLQVGLPYLTLDRTAPTLSGGELQRVRLSSQLGSDLVGLTYILDEPSIGLHPRDHHLMIGTMTNLRDKGNTVIVVEHDRDTMLAAYYLIDVGPGAGVQGGEIVAAGPVADIIGNPASATGRFLAQAEAPPLPELSAPARYLTLEGCSGNNLKNIDVAFPLQSMCCITGLSGSGKSTLVFDTLIPALDEALNRKPYGHKPYRTFRGYEGIGGFAQMDQTPIGKSSRSIPATYIGVFDAIRALYAAQPEAVKQGLSESHFSFNSKDGQCPACEGLGQVKIALQYMADHWVTCPECKGSRYREPVLEVHYKGKSIADVLRLDISEAIAFFAGATEITGKLVLLEEVGLSYLGLGQSTTTLSGGEAQRLKLSKELGGKRKKHMVYILDEPTTGLHLQDIEKLLLIFRKLVDAGNSLFIIEHNMDIVRAADWVIDVGPEGGDAGGTIIAAGTPRDIKTNPASITGRYL